MSEDEADAVFVELDVDVMGTVEAGEGGSGDCGDPGLSGEHGPQHEQPCDEVCQAAELREWPGDRHGQWKGTGGKGGTFRGMGGGDGGMKKRARCGARFWEVVGASVPEITWPGSRRERRERRERFPLLGLRPGFRWRELLAFRRLE